MRVITLNVNGLRSAINKGFFSWMVKQQADFVCLQEIKIHEEKLTDTLLSIDNYKGYFYNAQKSGYSGVAIYSPHTPQKITKGLGWSSADDEGRYLQLDFDRFSIISIYLPSGTTGEVRQKIKYDFLDRLSEHLKKLLKVNREFIICGDWNIAHKKIDIKNWRGNQKHSGFLPEERAWMDKLFDTIGFVDAFRVINQEEEQYTWWSNRGQAWAKNVGWRIDYQVITPGLANCVKRVMIYKDERFSDHAPLIIDYENQGFHFQ